SGYRPRRARDSDDGHRGAWTVTRPEQTARELENVDAFCRARGLTVLRARPGVAGVEPDVIVTTSMGVVRVEVGRVLDEALVKRESEAIELQRELGPAIEVEARGRGVKLRGAHVGVELAKGAGRKALSRIARAVVSFLEAGNAPSDWTPVEPRPRGV